MKKRFVSLLLTVLLVACVTIPVHAEEFTGGDGWSVSFDGSKMESNFTTSDISDAVHAIQPGDRVTIHLDLKNASTVSTDWYMTNEVLSSLEDSQKVATGGAYTYILTYYDQSGAANVLYDSDSVGGEKTSVLGDGLHEATDSLDEYFYLDTLTAGQTGAITLVVALDGETQGNAYQDTLAELKMNFAVELTSATASPSPSGSPSKPAASVNTGDESNLAVWVVVMALSAVALVVLLVVGRKNRKEARGHE